MKLVAIEELKENDVVLVNRPRPSSGGGVINRRYFGRVAHSCNSSSSGYENEVVVWDSWIEHFSPHGVVLERRSTSLCHFGKDEKGATAQLIGRWNPETRQVEPV